MRHRFLQKYGLAGLHGRACDVFVLVVRRRNIYKMNVIATDNPRPFGLNLYTEIISGAIGTIGLRFASDDEANVREVQGITNSLVPTGSDADHRHSKSLSDRRVAHRGPWNLGNRHGLSRTGNSVPIR